MAEILDDWKCDLELIDCLQPEEYTPALPFIQDFENPLRPTLTNSVSIGEYADFGDFGDFVGFPQSR